MSNWRAYGRGVTTCGFCGAVVAYEIKGQDTIVGSRNLGNVGMPLFCDELCDRAWSAGVDKQAATN